MNANLIELSDWVSDARRDIERDRERLAEKMEKMDCYRKALDIMDELLEEAEALKAENETLREQLSAEKKLRAEQEVKLEEMSKLSAGMAKKTSQDDLFKAMRSYLNISKRKSPAKREAAKMVFTELSTSTKLDLPEDIREMLDHLDDEQAESSAVATVNVAAGGINVQQANTVRK
jgi:DNA repair exonuclease SbcCD ATPase subunit